jgi:hypothetical protein
VSRIDDKRPAASRGEATGVEAGGDVETTAESVAFPVSSVQPIGGNGVTDETERTRLIADIMRLMREPAMPENARVASMTLIGWLARRRPEESPHAIGIDEARESERRIRAARAKAR